MWKHINYLSIGKHLVQTIFPTGKTRTPFLLRFLVGHENKGFNIGFPEWAYLRCIQGIILQGVLHQLLLHRCNTMCRLPIQGISIRIRLVEKKSCMGFRNTICDHRIGHWPGSKGKGKIQFGDGWGNMLPIAFSMEPSLTSPPEFSKKWNPTSIEGNGLIDPP
jgi:hypothetical protein